MSARGRPASGILRRSWGIPHRVGTRGSWPPRRVSGDREPDPPDDEIPPTVSPPPSPVIEGGKERYDLAGSREEDHGETGVQDGPPVDAPSTRSPLREDAAMPLPPGTDPSDATPLEDKGAAKGADEALARLAEELRRESESGAGAPPPDVPALAARHGVSEEDVRRCVAALEHLARAAGASGPEWENL